MVEAVVRIRQPVWRLKDYEWLVQLKLELVCHMDVEDSK